MREYVKKALDCENNFYSTSEFPEDTYDTIIEALRGVIRYNGLTQSIIDVHNALISTKKHVDGGSVSRPETDSCKDKQFEVIWMLLVQMFGDYGTSPRHGWIRYHRVDDALEFVKMLLD